MVESERRVRQQLAELQAMYDAAPAGLCVLDSDLRYVRVNQQLAGIHRRPVSEHLGARVRDVVPERADQIEDACRRVLETGSPAWNIEVQGAGGNAADSDSTWLVSCCPLRYDDGSVIGICMAVQDITPWKQTVDALLQKDEEVRQAQKMDMIGRLAGGIAHEFNNLLQVIGGYTASVMEELPAHTQAYEDLRQVRLAADRAAVLSRQLLSFSRRQVLQRTAVDLNQIVEELVRMVRPLISERIALEVNLDPSGGVIDADRGQLEQAFLNLCLNARDAMPCGGKLMLATESVTLHEPAWGSSFPFRPGRYVVFSAADTGVGMSAEVQRRIFEPFFTTKETGKGTGLGLAVVHGIVQQHHGAICVSSQPGQGAKFKLYFPAADKVPERDGTEDRTPSPRGWETILVAEDEPVVRSLVVHILEQAGYTVLAAADGEEALRVFEDRRRDISLVFLDAIMPKLTGHEVCRRIKAKCPETRIVFCTGYDPEIAQSEFSAEEQLRLIGKPFDARALLRVVRQVLDERTANPCPAAN
jgi:signal transduction histidine kinase/CheY-like chemotaxis protein